MYLACSSACPVRPSIARLAVVPEQVADFPLHALKPPSEHQSDLQKCLQQRSSHKRKDYDDYDDYDDYENVHHYIDEQFCR